MGKMRLWVSLLGMMAVGLTGARAQSEALFAPDTRDSIVPGPPVGPPEARPEAEVWPSHPWSVDLLLGLETGVRLQRFLNGEKGYGWMIEGISASIMSSFLLPASDCRYGIAPWMGRHNVVSIAPGFNIQVLADTLSFDLGGRPTAFGVMIADVDI